MGISTHNTPLPRTDFARRWALRRRIATDCADIYQAASPLYAAGLSIATEVIDAK